MPGPVPALLITMFELSMIWELIVVVVPCTERLEAYNCPTTVKDPEIDPPFNFKKLLVKVLLFSITAA